MRLDIYGMYVSMNKHRNLKMFLTVVDDREQVFLMAGPPRTNESTMQNTSLSPRRSLSLSLQ